MCVRSWMGSAHDRLYVCICVCSMCGVSKLQGVCDPWIGLAQCRVCVIHGWGQHTGGCMCVIHGWGQDMVGCMCMYVPDVGSGHGRVYVCEPWIGSANCSVRVCICVGMCVYVFHV